MGLKMRKSASILHYRDTKPTVYKLRQLTYPPIKEKALVKYVANSANVPESTIQAAIAAIAEGILYFALNGHRVVFPGFGGFYVGVKSKAEQSLADLSIEGDEKRNIKSCIKSCRLLYAPVTALREAVSESDTTIVDSGAYYTEE